MKEAWIVGNGGHAKVVASIWNSMRNQVRGFIDVSNSDNCINEKEFLDLSKSDPQTVLIGIGCVNSSKKRIDVCNKYDREGLEIADAISPQAIISNSVKYTGSGVVVMPGAIISENARIGGYCIINHGAVVDHDVEICKGVHIAPGAVIGGGVNIGVGSFIGAGAVVRQGICIGEYCTIGAGAVVIRDIPDEKTVVGCPARVVKQ